MDLYSIRKQISMGISIVNIKLRVTDYARVSTDSKEQQKSLQNQVEHFEEYIKKNENWTYIEGYVDEGITGTSDIKRNNFMRMIEDAKYGKFDLIITKEISRFSRNTLDSIKYTRELLSYGVAVFFVNDNINTALPDSELRLTIMASMAQDEIRRLSERVKFGMNRAIQRGEILGNDLMYGYRKNKDNGNLYIVSEEAKVIRQIYELYTIEEKSLSNICNKFNELNMKTRLGKKWSVSTLSRIIKNPKYKGYYCGRKTEIIDYMTKKVKYLTENEWIVHNDKKKIPPIVTEDLWNKANKRLKDRKKNKSFYKNRYIYSGKIYCSRHNCVFHRKQFRRNKKEITWVCSEYIKSGKQACSLPNIRESEINFIIKDVMDLLNIDFNKVKDLLMNLYKNEKFFSVDNDINKEKKIQEELYHQKEKLLDLNLNGIINVNEFIKKRNTINRQLELSKNKIKELLNYKKENVNTQYDIEKLLIEKIKSEITFKEIVNHAVNKIIVFGNLQDKINASVYLYNNVNEGCKKLFSKNYSFKRGYDTKSTRRYEINYEVDFYL